MNAQFKQELDRYIKHISALDEVHKIYLFGSCINGDSDDANDIDLLVLVDEGLDRLKVGMKLNKGLFDRTIPLDILVDWESSFELKAQECTLQREVKSKGVLLYDKHGMSGVA